ncbi:MAG: hypothetical protein HUJ73_05030, partial [Eubacterium sp.]|nr:hypothetical protein [Eubacterium sp.]
RKSMSSHCCGNITSTALTQIRNWEETIAFLSKHQVLPKQSMANLMASSIINLLNQIQTYDTFMDAVSYLKTEGLDKLLLDNIEDGFLYTDWQYEIIHHLRQDAPEDFQRYLGFRMYEKNMLNSAKISILRNTKKKQKRIIDKCRTVLTELSEYVSGPDTVIEKEKLLQILKQIK